jgi:hypothetical protein
VNVGSAVVLAAIAIALWYWKVGQGSWNWGPRLAGVLMLAAGTAVTATVAPIARTLSSAIGSFLAQLVPPLASILSTLGSNAPWIAGAILLALWVWALLPGHWFSKQRMDWRLAMGAVVIPALVLSAPAGPVATASQAVIQTVSGSVGSLTGGVGLSGS